MSQHNQTLQSLSYELESNFRLHRTFRLGVPRHQCWLMKIKDKNSNGLKSRNFWIKHSFGGYVKLPKNVGEQLMSGYNMKTFIFYLFFIRYFYKMINVFFSYCTYLSGYVIIIISSQTYDIREKVPYWSWWCHAKRLIQMIIMQCFACSFMKYRSILLKY